MKFSYAFRRGALYPFYGGDRELPPPPIRRQFLQKLSQIGFEGIEVLLRYYDPPSENKVVINAIREDLEAAGISCVAVNAGGGSLSHPRVANQNLKMIERAIEMAAMLEAKLVNVALVSPPTDPSGPGAGAGERISQGSSRLAKEDDFSREAKGLAHLADVAAPHGISLTIEIHQHSIADNSWAILHLLELANRPNIGINPDLGNIQQAYDTPEETMEEAIKAVAPHCNYWHCKNAHRIPLPELGRTTDIRVPLPDGDIDYRFAISAMLEAGFDSYLAVEGSTGSGDALTRDARSLNYVKSLAEELSAERLPR